MYILQLWKCMTHPPYGVNFLSKSIERILPYSDLVYLNEWKAVYINSLFGKSSHYIFLHHVFP